MSKTHSVFRDVTLKENFAGPIFEAENGPDPRHFEQARRNNFLDATSELDPGKTEIPTMEDLRNLLDDQTDPPPQDEFSPITSRARHIIIQALKGHMDSLSELKDQVIIDTLSAHIHSTVKKYGELKHIPERVIDGMVEIAREALKRLKTQKD